MSLRQAAVLLALLILAVPRTSFADDQAMFEVYADSPYTYCDAEALALLWGTEVYEAKVAIGNKLTEGSEEILRDTIRMARENPEGEGQLCEESGLDAEGYEGGYGEGYERDFTGEMSDEEYAFSWEKYGYAYCDAQLLAQLWGSDTWEAKIRAGRMVGEGQYDDIKVALDQARMDALARHQRCDLEENGFSMDDAAALARLWELDVRSSKTRMEEMITVGEQWVLWDELKVAQAMPPEGRPAKVKKPKKEKKHKKDKKRRK